MKFILSQAQQDEARLAWALALTLCYVYSVVLLGILKGALCQRCVQEMFCGEVWLYCILGNPTGAGLEHESNAILVICLVRN